MGVGMGWESEWETLTSATGDDGFGTQIPESSNPGLCFVVIVLGVKPKAFLTQARQAIYH